MPSAWIQLAENKQERRLIAGFGTLVYSEPVWEASKDAVFAMNENVSDNEYAHFIQMAQAILGHNCLHVLSRNPRKGFASFNLTTPPKGCRTASRKTCGAPISTKTPTK